jgi:sulfhydrogenase subunit beta (sulfur reductase)
MKAFFISDTDFPKFVESLIKSVRVVAPVAKKNKFVFDKLESSSELRLDYDVTILPPKRAIMPPKQELVRFNHNKVESAINPIPQVLLGVHFYDVKAIDMLDEVFRSGHADYNYLAQREQTTIVASNVQKISERAFFGTVGAEVAPKGHDAYLTKIKGGYVYEALSDKGEALTRQGTFAAATATHSAEAKQVNEAVMKECPEKLQWSSKEISDKVRASFGKNEVWGKLSEQCFSCGTCNLVCPTCYCFDVQDEWNLDQTSGTRSRTWDGCLLEDFAKVSLGGGHTENFREQVATRFRHRVMRKTTYLNEKLGGPACVGCGRCSAGCVPDIADPVNIIKKIMEG